MKYRIKATFKSYSVPQEYYLCAKTLNRTNYSSDYLFVPPTEISDATIFDSYELVARWVRLLTPTKNIVQITIEKVVV